jgi:hypothetical protein
LDDWRDHATTMNAVDALAAADPERSPGWRPATDAEHRAWLDGWAPLVAPRTKEVA